MAPKAVPVLSEQTPIRLGAMLVILGAVLGGALYAERRLARLEVVVEQAVRDREANERILRIQVESWVERFRASNASTQIQVPPFDLGSK
jgi:hypothetical protein